MQHITAEFLHKNKNEKIATIVNFWVAHLLVEQGKPFTDGELIKSCLIAAAKDIFLEKINLFKTSSLSLRTVPWRVEDTGSNIYS